jgi:pectin methylesterase-like acyl-CoA thioesterase
VQGAIDFVPVGNTQRVFILVRKGTYTEINNVVNKPFITVYGEDRNQTIIQYPNNDTLQSPNGNNRIQFFDFSPEFALANLTVHNITPQGGSQAEAFGSGASRHVVVDGVNILSLQDSFYAPSGTTYVVNSFIAGNVDFMWGGGAVYFQNDELQAVGGTSVQYYAWPRNSYSAVPGFNSPGFVYVNCRFTRADASVTNSYIARNDPRPYPNGFPYSQMVLINCQLAPNIVPAGWLIFNATTAPNVRYWEYHSTDLSGNPIDVSQRASFSSRISAELARRWSSIPFVLAGWVPDLTSVLPPGLQLTAAKPAQ